MTGSIFGPVMAALGKFEAAGANLPKLEALSGDLVGLRPTGIIFGPYQNIQWQLSIRRSWPHERRASGYLGLGCSV